VCVCVCVCVCMCVYIYVYMPAKSYKSVSSDNTSDIGR